MRRSPADDEDGAVAVLAAVAFVGLFTIAAMVVQFGFSRDVRSRSQNASDASALAAAYAMKNTAPTPDFAAAVSAAQTYAQVNYDVALGDWATNKCSDPTPLAYRTTATNCVSFDSSTSPTKVRVVMPTRETITSLGQGAGATSLPITSYAEVTVNPGAALTCALCFLASVDSGNADYTVSGSSIAVSGDVSMGPNGTMTTTGGVVAVSGAATGGTFSPSPVTKIASFPDPWAGRTDLPPATSGLSVKTDPCSSTSTGGQGIYGSFAFPKSTCTLQPGLYVVTGAWTESNNSVIAGTGVTLYFTCGTTTVPAVCTRGASGGSLGGKNGEISISAPTVSTTPRTAAVTGVAVLYDRLNDADIGLQGNGGTNITGAVYAPSSSLDFNGNSCFGFSQGPVIVTSVIKANGNKSCVKVSNAVGTTYANLPGTGYLSK